MSKRSPKRQRGKISLQTRKSEQKETKGAKGKQAEWPTKKLKEIYLQKTETKNQERAASDEAEEKEATYD
jgi:hypothetical protein